MASAHTAAWRRTDVAHGLGLVSLEIRPRGSRASGREIMVGDGAWYSVTFTVTADAGWRALSLEAEVLATDGARTVSLAGDGRGSWVVDGLHAPQFDGCLDVDIAATPCTNTHAFKRLSLDVGKSADINVVWIDVPSLAVSLSHQRYTRLAPHLYEFRTLDSGNAYELSIDDNDMVVDYQNFAERIVGGSLR